MLRIVLWKFLRGLSILVGATLTMFLLVHAIPGNPWNNYSSNTRVILGMELDKNLNQQLDRHFGLDLPLWRQYIRYIIGDVNQDGSFFCGAVCGNLGPSITKSGSSIQDILFEPPNDKTFWESLFGFSIRLVLFGSLFAVGLGVPLGILSAAKPKSVVGRSISVGLAALISIPNFVLGLLAILILATGLKLISVLPDWTIPSHWIVPAFVLAAMPMANIARVTRASLINIMGEDYVRTARAKGMRQSRVVLVHVLRNALVPMITYMGPTLMEMFTGLFIVENLFSFPGIGREYWNAVLKLDYPMILGLTLIYAIGILMTNGLVTILCEILDPRLRSVRQPGAL